MKEWFSNNWLGIVSLIFTFLGWMFYYLFRWLKSYKQHKSERVEKKKQSQMKDDLARVAEFEKEIQEIKNKWGIYDKKKESNVKA